LLAKMYLSRQTKEGRMDHYGRFTRESDIPVLNVNGLIEMQGQGV